MELVFLDEPKVRVLARARKFRPLVELVQPENPDLLLANLEMASAGWEEIERTVDPVVRQQEEHYWNLWLLMILVCHLPRSTFSTDCMTEADCDVLSMRLFGHVSDFLPHPPGPPQASEELRRNLIRQVNRACDGALGKPFQPEHLLRETIELDALVLQWANHWQIPVIKSELARGVREQHYIVAREGLTDRLDYPDDAEMEIPRAVRCLYEIRKHLGLSDTRATAPGRNLLTDQNGKGKKRRGRPRTSDYSADAKFYHDWKATSLTLKEFADARKISFKTAKKAVDRHRKNTPE